MSGFAMKLQQLRNMPQPHGALTEHLLREVASELIAPSTEHQTRVEYEPRRVRLWDEA